MRILQVEDDPLAAQGNALILRSVTRRLDRAETGGEALHMLRDQEYDLLVVDVGLPDMTGDHLVRDLRARGIETPVAVLSGYDDTAIKTASFGVGADDYIVKPVMPDELLARIRAIMRRTRGFSRNRLCHGALQLDRDARRVSVAGQDVTLTRKEFGLLELLLERRGRPVPRAAILEHLYGDSDEPGSRTIEVFLCCLRRKLAAAGMPRFIRTLPGVGYSIDHPADHHGASEPDAIAIAHAA